jgi:hypothetical protein
MESGLRKGYRGGARRSSKVGVPEWLWVSRGGYVKWVSRSAAANPSERPIDCD